MRMKSWPSVHRYLLLVILLVWAVVVHAQDYGRMLESEFGRFPDFAANLRVQMIGNRLARAAELPQASFTIFNHKDLNALALPDGRIYITSMMATAVTDDELAFVLGHELTHIKERHAQNQQERATGGAILGAILAALLGGNEQTIRLGADLGGGLTYGHYSRKDEHKADTGGVRLMTIAGYDPTQAANAMQRLIDRYGAGDANIPILGWFATHPDSKSRKQRLTELAAEMHKHPPMQLPPPRGIKITIDPSARHAEAWLAEYLAYRLTKFGFGQYVVITPAPVVGQPAPATRDRRSRERRDAPLLSAVTVPVPQVPPVYEVVISLRRIQPELGYTEINPAVGTAAEVALHWKELDGLGFSGIITARAQTKERVPWQAHEQLRNPEQVRKLADGADNNLEATLEAVAVRRAAMAFSEMLEAQGPVHHDAPVTCSMSTKGLRTGDYVSVVRGGRMISEVFVTSVEKKAITGTVLWGAHTWKKGDRFQQSL